MVVPVKKHFFFFFYRCFDDDNKNIVGIRLVIDRHINAKILTLIISRHK